MLPQFCTALLQSQIARTPLVAARTLGKAGRNPGGSESLVTTGRSSF